MQTINFSNDQQSLLIAAEISVKNELTASSARTDECVSERAGQIRSTTNPYVLTCVVLTIRDVCGL